MFARGDLDAVMIAVPDHQHAGGWPRKLWRGHLLDIYGEKPLAKTIAEQQAIVHAVRKKQTHLADGFLASYSRMAPFHKAAEIVRNGLIGDVTRVEVGLPSGHHDFKGTEPALLKKFPDLPQNFLDMDGKSRERADFLSHVVPGSEDWKIATSEPPPADLDYETWIGPSRMEPYIEARLHMNWRWNYNTGGGQLLDWIGHHCDIAHWGLGFDNNGPSEIEGHGDFPAPDALWNTCTKYRIELKYPRNITMIIAGGYDDIRGGTKWIGTDGWVWVDRGGFEASNPDWKKGKNIAEELRKIKLYESPGHWRNFLDCVKSRQPTIAPVQTAHHSAIPGHLGLISMLVGRKISWSVQHEKILGDSAMQSIVDPPVPLAVPDAIVSYLVIRLGGTGFQSVVLVVLPGT